MNDLTAEDILKVNDLSVEPVDVPEWGGRCYVTVLTGFERDYYEGSMVKMVGRKAQPNTENSRARLCVLGMCDASGKRIFNTNHINELGKKSASALDRVYDAIIKLNRMDEGDTEDAVKNSDSDQSDDSGSS